MAPPSHRLERPAVYLAVLVLLASVAVASVDFHAATTEVDAEAQVSTGALGNAAMPTGGPLALYVAGDDRFTDRLADALTAELATRYQVVPVTELSGTTDSPVLVVAPVERSLAYNPVVPSARVELRFVYVTSGDLTRWSDEPFDAPRFLDRLRRDDLGTDRLSDDHPYVRHGHVVVTTRSTGVLTWPGFRGVVVDQTAAVTADRFTAV